MIQEKTTYQVLLVDTSAILSGKRFDTYDAMVVTSSLMADELQEGGRDHRQFEYLQAKGLQIHTASKDSLMLIKGTAKQLGEDTRLSKADMELLALAVDVVQVWKRSVVILTDDYSIQNVAAFLQIPYEPISQKGITKKFKWVRRCVGCRRILSESVDACPVCGSPVTFTVQRKNVIKKQEK